MKRRIIIKKSLGVVLALNILPVLFALLPLLLADGSDTSHISILQGYCAGLIMDAIGIVVIGFIFLATWLLISN